MGSSKSTAQFLKKIDQAGKATDRHRKQAVSDGALEAKKVMLASASARGVQLGGKIAGRKWNVRYDVKGVDLPVALVRFTGPFHLVNNPTKPHYIAAKGLGGTRASRGDAAFQASAARFLGGSSRGSFASTRKSKGKRSLKFGSSNYAYVFHPGTPGKDIMKPARAIAERTVPPVMAKSMKGTWHKVFA